MLYRWLCSFMQGMRHTPHQQNMTSFVMSLGCLDLDCAFSGGYAKDPVIGFGGADIIRGGAGDDILVGNGGSVNINGPGIDDELVGNDGADVLSGGRWQRFTYRARSFHIWAF